MRKTGMAVLFLVALMVASASGEEQEQAALHVQPAPSGVNVANTVKPSLGFTIPEDPNTPNPSWPKAS